MRFLIMKSYYWGLCESCKYCYLEGPYVECSKGLSNVDCSDEYEPIGDEPLELDDDESED